MNEKIKILLVDDSIQWLASHKNMLETLFEKGTLEIDTAISAAKGFSKILANSDYNLVITDLEMERIIDEDYAGVWLLKNLINREEYKNIKFLIISGSYDIKDVALSLNVDYIPKDFLLGNPDLLKYKITEIFGNIP